MQDKKTTVVTKPDYAARATEPNDVISKKEVKNLLIGFALQMDAFYAGKASPLTWTDIELAANSLGITLYE